MIDVWRWQWWSIKKNSISDRENVLLDKQPKLQHGWCTFTKSLCLWFKTCRLRSSRFGIGPNPSNLPFWPRLAFDLPENSSQSERDALPACSQPHPPNWANSLGSLLPHQRLPFGISTFQTNNFYRSSSRQFSIREWKISSEPSLTTWSSRTRRYSEWSKTVRLGSGMRSRGTGRRSTRIGTRLSHW